MTWTVKILSHGRTVAVRKKQVLSDVLRQAGVPISLYCNKRGLCGKCFVEIKRGKLPPLGEKERSWLVAKGLSPNYRLSCQYEVASDLEVRVPSAFTVQEIPILPSIMRSFIRPDPAIRKYYLELRRPDIRTPESLLEILLDGLGGVRLGIQPAVLRKLEEAMAKGDSKVTAVVHREREILALEPGYTVGRSFGLAIDVGTTTLVMELVDLDSGKTLDMEAAINQQVKRGADVVSRISYCYENSEHAAELQSLVLETLNSMIGRLLARSRIDRESVYEAVIAGNTVMTHLLLEIPVRSLARAPYEAVFSRLPELHGSDLGLNIHPQAKIYFSPNIMSFVGGDIAAGLLASRLARKRGRFLFLDLGTNGEIVLRAGGRIVTSSTAAGPAFEGMNISCGLPALPGAIFKIRDEGEIRIETLGDSTPRGICGTGLIDAIAVFLARGEISRSGIVRNPARQIRIRENIVLTQEDVRQMQLACAAIKTGIRILLEQNRLSVEDLDGIYIAGAFGNYLNIENSMDIGLLPRIDKGRLNFIGNASLAGARQMLLSARERESAEKMVQAARYVSLASEPQFQERFIEALEFAPWP